MCKQRGHSFCSELGADISLWSKESPLPKPEWINAAAQTFSDSLQLALKGKLDDAKSLLKEAPEIEMRAWVDVHAQNSGTWRFKALGIPTPEPILPLDTLKTFTKFESSVFGRDNFRCR